MSLVEPDAPDAEDDGSGKAARFAELTTTHTSLAVRYWKMKGTDRVDSMDSFYKNLSIMGGFLLLYTKGSQPGAGERRRSIVRLKCVRPY